MKKLLLLSSFAAVAAVPSYAQTVRMHFNNIEMQVSECRGTETFETCSDGIAVGQSYEINGYLDLELGEGYFADILGLKSPHFLSFESPFASFHGALPEFSSEGPWVFRDDMDWTFGSGSDGSQASLINFYHRYSGDLDGFLNVAEDPVFVDFSEGEIGDTLDVSGFGFLEEHWIYSRLFSFRGESRSYSNAVTFELIPDVAPVPLPASGFLLLGAFAAFGAVCRKQQKAV